MKLGSISVLVPVLALVLTCVLVPTADGFKKGYGARRSYGGYGSSSSGGGYGSSSSGGGGYYQPKKYYKPTKVIYKTRYVPKYIYKKHYVPKYIVRTKYVKVPKKVYIPVYVKPKKQRPNKIYIVNHSSESHSKECKGSGSGSKEGSGGSEGGSSEGCSGSSSSEGDDDGGDE